MASKRELLTSRGASRYIRRDEKGRFTSAQVDVGSALTADSRVKAKAVAPKGQGDRGDQKNR